MYQLKTRNIDVTCVVIGHRESHTITATIRSVLRAAEAANDCGVSTEVLIVLDDPDDDTSCVVGTFEEQGCFVENVFYRDLSDSRNHAAQIANGKYLAFIDGDDLWSKSWVIGTLLMSRNMPGCVFHPQYNIYFGDMYPHVMHHVDMDDGDFVYDAIYRENYWTALSFSEKQVYLDNPYVKNELDKGFGYEDWTWNVETVNKGIRHHTVNGTCHFIRRMMGSPSLLNLTNTSKSLPTNLPIYRNTKNEVGVL